MFDPPAELLQFLSVYPPNVRDAMVRGREILMSHLGEVSELVYDATAAVCDGFSHTYDLKGLFVNLAAYSDHVTLVFYWGTHLSDPQGRLMGSGKQVRHMRLASASDLDDPYVIDLVKQAEAKALRPEPLLEPKVVVKIYEGPKRRPRS